jgi:hypothetical protein
MTSGFAPRACSMASCLGAQFVQGRHVVAKLYVNGDSVVPVLHELLPTMRAHTHLAWRFW